MVVSRGVFLSLFTVLVGCAGSAGTDDSIEMGDPDAEVHTPIDRGGDELDTCDVVGSTRACGESCRQSCVSQGEFGATWGACVCADNDAALPVDEIPDAATPRDGGALGVFDATVPREEDAGSPPIVVIEDPPLGGCPYGADLPAATGRGRWSTFENQAPTARASHVAVWTGSEMIVWGGSSRTYLDSGAIYDPRTSTWRAMTGENAPRARVPSGVWTGSRFLVFGGAGQRDALSGGGAYDPVRDEWTTLPRVCLAPGHYITQWTGTKMLVWNARGGALYDPATQSWSMMSQDGAPTYDEPSHVWTGSRFLVWGGHRYMGATLETSGEGASYDPTTDRWTAIASRGAPPGSYGHRAVWTGSKMIVWGGTIPSHYEGSTYIPPVPSETGGIYDPATDTWSAVPAAPAWHADHEAIWTGDRMLVFGGVSGAGSGSFEGAFFDPATGAWTELAERPSTATFRPNGFSLVLAGDRAIFFGGYQNGSGDTFSNMGATLDVHTGEWGSLHVSSAQPRIRHAGAFGGDRVFVFGGTDHEGHRLATGDVIDLATQRVTPMSTTGAPSARELAASVWTGSHFIVWGGDELATGGVYDPATNTWRATSTTNAPTGRSSAVAAWTGREMIVWGGTRSGVLRTDGAAYDPVRDTWRPIATEGAPPGRYANQMVWSGRKIIVWGGDNREVAPGAIYDPMTDRWEAFATEGAPSVEYGQSVVAFGSTFFVWSGGSSVSPSTIGALYDLDTRTWSAIPTAGAPEPRVGALTVWTGSEVIVWGGTTDSWTHSGSGGAFDPSTRTWTTLEPRDAPTLQVAIGGYSGGKLHVWGGWGGQGYRAYDANHSMLGAALDLTVD